MNSPGDHMNDDGKPSESFYLEVNMPEPRSTLREKLFRLRCWLTKRLVCSWRGHGRAPSFFCWYCPRCRYKLPLLTAGPSVTIQDGDMKESETFTLTWYKDGGMEARRK